MVQSSNSTGKSAGGRSGVLVVAIMIDCGGRGCSTGSSYGGSSLRDGSSICSSLSGTV